MTISTYRQHLLNQGNPDTNVENRLAAVREFAGFLESEGLRKSEAAGKPEAEAFARRLIGEGRNTLENFYALADYAEWAGWRGLHVAWIELADCHNALDVLASEIRRGHGEQARAGIFPRPLPPLGAGETERSGSTREITERMAGILTAEQSRRAWFKVQHGIPAGHWENSDAADRETFLQAGSIDAFLAFKRRERDILLTRLRDEDKLWYTVRITDKVLEFVKSDPEMEVGRREGEEIFVSKIPYNAVRFLEETDPRMKRYYACHCPLVRQSILEDRPISPDVCHCSLGHASHYLAGIGRPYRGEVLESALKGDVRCRFVFHQASPQPSP